MLMMVRTMDAMIASMVLLSGSVVAQTLAPTMASTHDWIPEYVTPYTPSTTPPEYSYTTPQTWGSIVLPNGEVNYCSGSLQSPIGFPCPSTYNYLTCPFQSISYNNGECLATDLAPNASKNVTGDEWKVKGFQQCPTDALPYLNVTRTGGEVTTWKLANIHAHTNSEHTFASVHHDLELHLEHYDARNSSKKMIVAIMFHIDDTNADDSYLEPYWDILKTYYSVNRKLFYSYVSTSSFGSFSTSTWTTSSTTWFGSSVTYPYYTSTSTSAWTSLTSLYSSFTSLYSSFFTSLYSSTSTTTTTYTDSSTSYTDNYYYTSSSSTVDTQAPTSPPTNATRHHRKNSTEAPCTTVPPVDYVPPVYTNIQSVNTQPDQWPVSPYSILDFTKPYGVYIYKGSETTPPCEESVTWVVYEVDVSISAKQVADVQTFFAASGYTAPDGMNARPTQDINGRDLYYCPAGSIL